MSNGYVYLCNNCQKKYSIYLGVGMMMPKLYEESIQEIKQGKWGNRSREVINNQPFITPDVETDLYICNHCGSWKLEKNMSLYAPDNLEVISELHHGQDSNEEADAIPFVCRSELEEFYHLVKRCVHFCKCGKRMHKASFDEIYTLSCPYCGKMNSVIDFIRWD